MLVLARIPTLPADAPAVASPRAAASPPVSTAAPARVAPVHGPSCPWKKPSPRPASVRPAIPDWSIAALAAVAIAVWSLAAWRDAGDGRADRVAVDSPTPSDSAAARTR